LPYTKIIADGLTLNLKGADDPVWIEGQDYLPVNLNGLKHAWRYSPYHRMDMSVRRRIMQKPFALYASVWWVNVYNHLNVFFYRYQGAYINTGKMAMLPSVPFLGIEAEF
jgi:hypothetical protein